MIAAGQTLPPGNLMESTSFDEGTGCPLGPQEVDVSAASKDKKIVIFGLPGAYTPTCSAKHVPSFIQERRRTQSQRRRRSLVCDGE